MDALQSTRIVEFSGDFDIGCCNGYALPVCTCKSLGLRSGPAVCKQCKVVEITKIPLVRLVQGQRQLQLSLEAHGRYIASLMQQEGLVPPKLATSLPQGIGGGVQKLPGAPLGGATALQQSTPGLGAQGPAGPSAQGMPGPLLAGQPGASGMGGALSSLHAGMAQQQQQLQQGPSAAGLLPQQAQMLQLAAQQQQQQQQQHSQMLSAAAAASGLEIAQLQQALRAQSQPGGSSLTAQQQQHLLQVQRLQQSQKASTSLSMQQGLEAAVGSAGVQRLDVNQLLLPSNSVGAVPSSPLATAAAGSTSGASLPLHSPIAAQHYAAGTVPAMQAGSSCDNRPTSTRPSHLSAQVQRLTLVARLSRFNTVVCALITVLFDLL